MSELALSLLRLGFLALLWCAVLSVIVVLTRDLRAPREAVVAGSGLRSRREPSRASRRTPTKLLVIEGPLRGTAIPLGTTPLLFGRVAEASVVLDDEYASNRHARLIPGDTGWLLEDLGSTNGTWIRNQRLTSPVPVDAGSKFRIGLTTFELSR